MRHTICAVLTATMILAAQQQPPPAPRGTEASAPPTGPLVMDLAAALEKARSYNPVFLQSTLATGLAHEDRLQARAALFPTIAALSQYVYTQGNGTPSGRFVANNGVHVYNDQATIHADLYSLAKRADYQRTIAAEAVARARQDIAGRGLAATVVQNYYAVIVAQRHEENARRSVGEAQAFLTITEKQERGGEVARADVLKARLQMQQRQRDLLDAQTNVLKAKIGLAVLLFADLAQPYSVVDDLRPDAPLPAADDARRRAVELSPEVRAAEAGMRQAEAGIASARAAWYPTLSVDYFFGIDANAFALKGPGDVRNLGSMVQGTLNIPVWNWGATHSKVRQAKLQQQQARYDLTFAQRGLAAGVSTAYVEAEAARAQLDSLRSSVDLSVESLRLTVLRYEAGEAVALEVVDAQSTLAQARNAYDDGLARYRLALASLEILTGRF